MNAEDLCYTPATELAGMIRNKEISPVEVTDAVLERIERLEPSINAFATLTADAAKDAAREAEAAVMRGDGLGALHGVPATIKDLHLLAGVALERGSHTMKGNVPDSDAPFAARLKSAGAVILGKTTTPEFGWKGVSQSPLTGITSNPWKHGYNTGASSAGAGAGAAAGFGPLHQGSDGAGSIRMPSHFSGVFGLKPTYGRIPNWPVSNGDQTSHIGPMTRTVRDAALMLHVMSGAHPWDHYSLEAPPEDYPALLAGELSREMGHLKVAFSPDLGHARVDPDVAALVADAAKVFEAFGCTVEEVTPDFGADGPELIRFFWPVHEAPLAKHFPEWEEKMDPGLVACIREGQGRSAVDYLNVRAQKLEYVEKIHRFLQEWDLLLTPAVSVAAFPAERLQPEHWPQHAWDWITWAEFSYPFNMSGSPAASIPCGFTEDGLPVGLQIVSRRFDDAGVLRAAAAFERTRPWAQHRPEIQERPVRS